MKKKTLAAILLGVCALSLCAVGCGKDDGKKTTTSLKGVKYTDVPADCSVEIFEPFSFDTAAISYEGKIYTPTVTVKYGDETVTTKNKSFIVEKLGEYTVTYVFDLPKGKETYTTKVTCVDTVAPTIVAETPIAGKVEYGSTVTVPTFGVRDASGETITPTVAVYAGEVKDENLVAVENGQFTVDSYEKYVYLVTAEDSSDNKTADESFGFVVRQEGEFEYFNSQEYASSALSVWADGVLEYVTDPAYVFEGEGALKYTTGGKWPDMRFSMHNQYIDVANVKAITYWVYNASDYNFRLDLTAYPTDARSGTIIGRSIAYAGVWTHVTVDCTNLATQFDPETMVLGIGMNGSDHKQGAQFEPNATGEYFRDMEIYLDAMMIHYETPEWDYSLVAPELTYYNGSTTSGTVPVLTAGNVTGVDIAEVAATVTGEDGITKKLKVQDGEFVIPNEVGKYKVHYFYKNGVQGFSVTQNVKIVEGYKTVKTYVDYEEEELNLDVSYIGMGSGTLSLSDEQVKQGKQSLKFENGLYSRWSAVAVKFSDEALDMLDENNDAISFSMYIDAGTCDATQYNVRVRDIEQSTDSSNLGYWLAFDSGVETGKWLNYTCSDSRVLTKIKEVGGIWFHVEIIGFTEGVEGDKIASRGYKLYLDDIKFVKTAENATAMDFENYAVGTVLAEKNAAKANGWNMWNCGSSSLTVSNLQAKTGSKSLMLEHKDKWPSFDIPFAQGMIDALVPGTTAVELSVYVDKHLDTDMSMYVLHWYPASGDTKCVVYRYSSLATVDLTGQWVTYTISDADTVEKVKAAGGLKLYFETGTADNSRLFIDDIRIIDVVNAQGYQNTEVTFPEGTTNNSTNSVEYTIDGATYNRWYGNGNFSVVSGEGTEKYLQHETSTKGPLVRITLPAEKIAAAAGAKEFSFRIQFVKHSSTATSFNVRVFNKGYGAGEDAVKFTQDENTSNFAAGVWIKISITDATAIAKILADGGFTLMTEGNGHTSGSYRVYIDDIAFTLDDSVKEAKGVNVAEYVASCLPEGATVNETVVKNAAGEVVTLTNGEFPAAGEYLVIVNLTVNGVAEIYEFKVNV